MPSKKHPKSENKKQKKQFSNPWPCNSSSHSDRESCWVSLIFCTDGISPQVHLSTWGTWWSSQGLPLPQKAETSWEDALAQCTWGLGGHACSQHSQEACYLALSDACWLVALCWTWAKKHSKAKVQRHLSHKTAEGSYKHALLSKTGQKSENMGKAGLRRTTTIQSWIKYLINQLINCNVSWQTAETADPSVL